MVSHLLVSELTRFFASIAKVGDSQDMLDEEGFCDLHYIIFNLFYDDDETNSVREKEAVSAPEPKYKDEKNYGENRKKRGTVRS